MAGKWLVDFDGTLVKWDGVWRGPENIGEPIEPMIDRVKMWLKQGRQVQIFTARVFPIGIRRDMSGLGDGFDARYAEAEKAYKAIREWTLQIFGQYLDVVCWKSYQAVELWDDRAVQVIPNTGRRVDEALEYYGSYEEMR